MISKSDARAIRAIVREALREELSALFGRESLLLVRPPAHRPHLWEQEAAIEEDRLGTALVGKAVTKASPKPLDEVTAPAPLSISETNRRCGKSWANAVFQAEKEAALLAHSNAASPARQKSWAPNPVDLPPIPPVVCGTRWTRDYIAERERIIALHRKAGRKVS
jgi:hypothetical protein